MYSIRSFSNPMTTVAGIIGGVSVGYIFSYLSVESWFLGPILVFGFIGGIASRYYCLWRTGCWRLSRWWLLVGFNALVWTVFVVMTVAGLQRSGLMMAVICAILLSLVSLCTLGNSEDCLPPWCRR
jgi:hypothetical protein